MNLNFKVKEEFKEEEVFSVILFRFSYVFSSESEVLVLGIFEDIFKF